MRNGQKTSSTGYKYVYTFLDNRGKRRWRYQKRGYPSKYLPSPREPEFQVEYSKALAVPRKTFNRATDGLDAAIELYLQSEAFKLHSESTKVNYRRRLSRLAETHGCFSIKTITRKDVINILNKAPSSAERNRTLSILKMVLDESLDQEIINFNVATTINRVKVKSKPYVAWSREEIKSYLDYHKHDKMACLAVRLLYFTGQRGSDIWNIGDDQFDNGRIVLVQQKTKAMVNIPVHEGLAPYLPIGSGVWLRTSQETPFRSVKSFQQWFSKRTRQAGVKNSAHGLRKSLGAHLATAKATPSEIQAVLGHLTLSEATRYTKDADKESLSNSALNLIKSL